MRSRFGQPGDTVRPALPVLEARNVRRAPSALETARIAAFKSIKKKTLDEVNDKGWHEIIDKKNNKSKIAAAAPCAIVQP